MNKAQSDSEITFLKTNLKRDINIKIILKQEKNIALNFKKNFMRNTAEYLYINTNNRNF